MQITDNLDGVSLLMRLPILLKDVQDGDAQVHTLAGSVTVQGPLELGKDYIAFGRSSADRIVIPLHAIARIEFQLRP